MGMSKRPTTNYPRNNNNDGDDIFDDNNNDNNFDDNFDDDNFRNNYGQSNFSNTDDGVHDIIIESNDADGRSSKVAVNRNSDDKYIGPNPYSKWIHAARAFDSWRPFPRLFISIYIYILYRTIEWYLVLPDPSIEQSGFVSVIVGAGAAWFGLYVGSGKSRAKDD